MGQNWSYLLPNTSIFFFTCTNTLLRVTSTLDISQGRVRIKSTQENRLILYTLNIITAMSTNVYGCCAQLFFSFFLSYLIHTSIGKQKSGIIVRNGGRRGDKGVAVIFKVLDEGRTNLVGGPFSGLLLSHIDLSEKYNEIKKKGGGDSEKVSKNKEKRIF